MKIFSSFDTALKQEYIHDFSERYGRENLVIITRSNLYFLKKVVVHIVFGLLVLLCVFFASYIFINPQRAIHYGIWIAVLLSLLFFIIAGENYIDYSMNYAIFTPDEAILVEQLGFFKRSIKSLDIRKIKSISIRKSSFIYSLFNDGMLTIFNEGSTTNGVGEIVFKYVNKPEQVKDDIHRIILASHEQNYHPNNF